MGKRKRKAKWNKGLTKETDKRVLAMSKKISKTSKKNRPVNVAKTINKSAMEKKYFENKKALDAVRADATLSKWKILSENKRLGKKIWGKNFSIIRLAKDMEMPFSTVRRCLALDKATKQTWALINNGELSAFKAAMICQLKNNGFQDEVVAAVVKDNLSTYQIKSFKPKNVADVNEWRHQKAVEKGYSRQEGAYKSISIWVQRGHRFLLMPLASVGPKRKEETLDMLSTIHSKLGVYLKKHGR